MQGQVQLKTGDRECKEIFRNLTDAQKQAYTSHSAPGSPFPSQDAAPLKIDQPSLQSTHFGLITCHIKMLDFVSLHPKGHQRVIAKVKEGYSLSKMGIP